VGNALLVSDSLGMDDVVPDLKEGARDERSTASLMVHMWAVHCLWVICFSWRDYVGSVEAKWCCWVLKVFGLSKS
jgi:hypothetical protein